MDGKKKQAFLQATGKLLQNNTPEADIINSLKELGLEENIAKQILNEAKKRNQKPKGGFWGPEGKGILGDKGKKPVLKPKISMSMPKKEKPEKGVNFFKNFLKKEENETEKTKPRKEKTFIPKLKKGGKIKVQEIIEKSFLDQPQKPTEKLTGKKLAKEIEKHETIKLDEMINSLEKKKTEREEDKKEPVNGTPIKSSLDFLEKKVEKGTSLEQASKEMTKKTLQNAAETAHLAEITILIIPNKEYAQGMSKLLKKADQTYQKIIYVNLNDFYKSLIRNLKRLDVDINKFFMVDAITLTSDKSEKKHDNVIFISSPNALIELSLGITQAINAEKPDLLIFDSLSTLLIYESDSTVTKFIHSLIGKIKAAEIDAFFTALEGDSQNEAIKDLSMFVDKVSTLTEFELGEMGFLMEGNLPKMRNFRIEKPIKPVNKQKPLDRKIFQQLEQNKIVSNEMDNLKNRLNEMQANKEITDSLKELKVKISKIDDLKVLQEQVKLISQKIDQKQEKPIDKTLINQIAKLEQKIESAEKKRGKKESEKYSRELKVAMQGLDDKIEKIEKLANLQTQVKKLSERIEKKKAKPVDNKLITQITKLTSKIDALEKRVAKKLKEKPSKKKKGKEENLKKKLDSYKKQLELQAMMNDFYKTDVRNVSPDKVVTKEIKKDLDRKKKFLNKAYTKGLLPEKMYNKGTKRIGKEVTRLQHAAEISSLEKKLDALNEAFDSGIISNESYTKGKIRIERLLKN